MNADRGGVQPDPGSMADDSMQEALRDAGRSELMLPHWWRRTCQQDSSKELTRLAWRLRLGLDQGIEADQVKSHTRSF